MIAISGETAHSHIHHNLTFTHRLKYEYSLCIASMLMESQAASSVLLPLMKHSTIAYAPRSPRPFTYFTHPHTQKPVQIMKIISNFSNYSCVNFRQIVYMHCGLTNKCTLTRVDIVYNTHVAQLVRPILYSFKFSIELCWNVRCATILCYAQHLRERVSILHRHHSPHHLQHTDAQDTFAYNNTGERVYYML